MSFVCGHRNDVGLFRAQVLSTDDDDDDVARIFLLDFGIVVDFDWPDLFLATKEMNLGEFEPQACLVRLQDLKAPQQNCKPLPLPAIPSNFLFMKPYMKFL